MGVRAPQARNCRQIRHFVVMSNIDRSVVIKMLSTTAVVEKYLGCKEESTVVGRSLVYNTTVRCVEGSKDT